MARHALDAQDGGGHGNVAAMHTQRLRAIQQLPPTRARSLIANEHDEVLCIRQQPFEMMEDSAAGEHAARRDDDPWTMQVVQLLRLRDGLREGHRD